MGARNLSEPQTLDRGVVMLFGGATGAGDANMTSVLGAGVSSVAYASSAGKFTITLADKWNKLLFFSALVIDATTPDDWEAVLSAESVASAKTLTVQFFKGGTATSPTSDELVKFMIVVSNTKQPPTAR